MARRETHSIALLMTIIGLLALNFGLMRWAFGGRSRSPSPAFLAMVLPMADLMILALPRLRPSYAHCGFWLGFEAAGVASIAVLAHMDRQDKDMLFYPLELVGQHFGPVNSLSYAIDGSTFCTLVFWPPQLLLAWLVGRLVAFPSRRRIDQREPIVESQDSPLGSGTVPEREGDG
jgi:hypothetical protein